MKNNNNNQWIFLRGLVRGQYHWHHFPSAFKQRFPDSQCYFVDLPGNGFSWHLTSPDRIEPMVDFVRARLQGALAPPFNIVALSLGGMVTLSWCHRFPREIRSAVIINSSIANLSRWYERFSLQQITNALRFLVGSAEMKEQAILNMTSTQEQSNYVIVQRWAELHRRYPTQLSNALRQLMAASRFKLKSPVEAPVLCVNAKGDPLVSPRCTEAIAKLLDAKLVTHASAGHDLSLDDPDWLADVIANWQNRLSD